MGRRKAVLLSLLAIFTSTLHLAFCQDGLCGGNGVHEGWFADDGFCYHIGYDQVTWHEAKEKCRLLESKLVSLRSKEGVNYLLNLLMEKPPEVNSLWTGLNSLRPDGAFAWDDETPFTLDEWSERALKDTANTDRKKCVSMDAKDGSWDLRSCNRDKMAFICMVPNPSWPTNPPLPPTTPTATGYCPEGWTTYGDRCYQLFGKERPVTFNEAKMFCRTKNPKTGHLASVHSPMDQSFLTTLIDGMGTNAWIGLQMNTVWREYFWEDESPVNFVDWSVDKPVTDTGDLCVEMLYLLNRPGKWNALPCLTSRRPFICQMSKESPPEVQRFPGTCPSEGWTDLGTSKCFIVRSTKELTWEDARAECQNLDSSGDLVSLHSSVEMKMLLPLMKDVVDSVWIGLRKYKRSENFGWSDESPTDFDHWAKGSPNGWNEFCVEMFARDLTWNDVDCDRTMNFVCATDKILDETYCGGSGEHRFWGAIEGVCYNIVSDKRVNWHVAKQECEKSGSKLASFSRREQTDYLFDRMKTESPGRDLWIGLNALGIDGTFAWDDGTILTLEQWNDETLEDTERKKCAYVDGRDGSWGVGRCNSEELGFVCSVPKPGWPTAPPPPVTPTAPGNCPRGWTSFGNKCYQLFGKENPTTWEEAKKACRAQNSNTGHLASIHSLMEQNVLMTLIDRAGTNAWIGLRKDDYWEEYIWEDDTQTDYVDWNKGMDVPRESNLCVEMMNLVLRPGKWNPLSCTSERPYICQMSKDPKLTIPIPPEPSSQLRAHGAKHRSGLAEADKP